MDPLLTNALYTGIFNAKVILDDNTVNYLSGGPELLPNNTSGSISPFCGTGNCTFEPYASLVITHRCMDITELLRYTDGSNVTHQNVTLPISPSFPPYPYDPRKVQELISTYSSYSFLDTNYTALNMFSPMPNISVEPPVTSLNSSPYIAGSLLFVEVFRITFNFSSQGVDTKAYVKASRCNLDFGMQVYSSSIENGVFLETLGEFVGGNWNFESYDETRNVNAMWY